MNRRSDLGLGSELISALSANGPTGPNSEKLMLFGRFVGSWRIEWHGSSSAQAIGELHFGWVLGGRAIQDIWIVPTQGEPGENQPPLAFHGTTIRFYDPTVDVWRSTWIDPINGRVRRFVGRPDRDEIVLVSDEEEPQLRWRFMDIRTESFTWQGETSSDRGATWAVDECMFATRT
jgi:hypothetical protein